MAGWNSPVSDPKSVLSVKYLRNKSFTKEEIKAYKRSNDKTEGDHYLIRTFSAPQKITQESGKKDSGAGFQRSNTFSPANIKEYFTNVVSETDREKIIWKNAWWTMSNWAFLNEPPLIDTEGPSNRYASQYHITNKPPLIDTEGPSNRYASQYHITNKAPMVYL
ncbi:hypothetical protein NE237_022501 [Protea cynaroides]|uniref:Uncharacterized protein n=1 Tax=Protea cynaroides TaxID=273540 RepID=A0A9Q0HEI2_9MAGN|nr:hypothetical protein NE237_022501 [Protea cynaroides]